jgi:hypothetical protein
MVKRADERLNERVGRFISGYKRQISERQKDLLNLEKAVSARSVRAENPTGA